MATFTMRMPTDLNDALKAMALLTGLSMSAIAEEAILKAV